MKKNFLMFAFWSAVLIGIIYLANSCGINHHYKRMEHHKEKLLEKGEELQNDTIVKRYYDTIVQTVTRNDTTYVYKTITNTIEKAPEIIVKDRWRVKTEYKYKYKTVKEETKQAKEQTKQVKAENKKSLWWLWLLIGGLIGFAIPQIIIIIKALRNLPIGRV